MQLCPKGVTIVADHWEQKHWMLEKLLHRAGLSKQDFAFADLYAPLPEGTTVVLALGDKALRATLGEHDIVRWRGRIAGHARQPGVWVVPIMAPSKLLSARGDVDPEALRHPPRFTGVWIMDAHKALQVARNGFVRKEVRYIVDPDVGTFDRFADEYFARLAENPNLDLSHDIETYYKQKNTDEAEYEAEEALLEENTILRHSFCFAEGYAISVPHNSSYRSTVARLLKGAPVLVGWNYRDFDAPLIRKDGLVLGGDIHDYMDGYHLLQSDLPKGIEWVTAEATDMLPWKHKNASEPGWYSCADADAGWRNAAYVREQLKKTGQWNLFLRHVVALMPILEAAGARGNLMDLEKRAEIRSRLIAFRDLEVAKLQLLVPRELFPRTEYKTLPEVLENQPVASPLVNYPGFTRWDACVSFGTDGTEWDILCVPEPIKQCSHCGQYAPNAGLHFKGTLGPPHPKTGKPTRVKNPCKDAKAEIRKVAGFVPRFYRLELFNANSSDQLLAFMRFHNHPVGVNKKDSSKDTADAGHLKSLRKQFPKFAPFYLGVLEVHKASKTIGTYTPEPDAQGFLHTLYTNTPSTWRFSSKKVVGGTQIQNWGKREENAYAKEARKQIIARPGHKLVQIDSSAVEAVMQGWEMNDSSYMNIASKSIHAWLACKELGLEFTPENVELVKDTHEKLYLEMKTVNYLTNFGGGPKLMADTFPEIFPTVKHAMAAQDKLYALLPSLGAYHHATRWEANKNTFLVTQFGYRHYYYDVFRRRPDGSLALSKDSKRAVALKPQNSNAGFQKDNLLLIAASKIGSPPITDIAYVEEHWQEIKANIAEGSTWAQFMCTNVSVHDSCCLDTPDALVEECSKMLMAIFTRPIPQMGGLKIGAEVEVGDNWGGWDEKKNPQGMKRTMKHVQADYTFADTKAGKPPLEEAA